jgi:hypothetical protein
MLLIFRGAYGSGVKGYATLAPRGVNFFEQEYRRSKFHDFQTWMETKFSGTTWMPFFPGRHKLYIHTSYILSNPFLSLKSWAPAAVFIQAPSTNRTQCGF